MTKINPCRHCREVPSSGYYAGDFSIECENCLVYTSRHFIDYPHKHFQASAKLAKEAAIVSWNVLNPIPKG